MLSLLITAAAASLTPDAGIRPRYVDVDGVRAVYTRSVDRDGTVHLRGFYTNERSPFHYKVRNGHVRAEIDGVPYRFAAPNKR